MKGVNGYLQYSVNGQDFTFPLWVMTLTQAHTLSGTTVQARWTKQFYPKAYAPGDMAVTGNCESQIQYQQMARFIRAHHKVLLQSTEAFTRLDPNAASYRRLMLLSVPTESIMFRGWVPSFTLSKKGVFDPAPAYSFNFTVIFDPHATNVEISHALQRSFFADTGATDVIPGDSSGSN